MTAKTLTQSYLKECLHYSPEDGTFKWITRDRDHFKCDQSWAAWNYKFSGKLSGGVCSNGYLIISIGGRSYRAHRLAFLYMKGVFPSGQIDHINHIRDDNRWVNIRSVTSAENCRNQSYRKDNKSGIIGVCWHKAAGKWHVRIGDGKGSNIGLYDNFFDAACAKKSAEIACGYHSNHGKNKPEIRRSARKASGISGVMGVSWHKGHKKWQAQTSHKGEYIYLGTFKDLFSAACARKSADNFYGQLN